MIKNLKKIIQAHPVLFGTLLVFLVTFLTYGQMLGMYFWQDDNAIIFKAQNIEGTAGYFGEGLYDRSSNYRFVATLVYPLYLLFGIEPTGYYLAGIIFYFFAALSIYFLVKVLTGKKLVALMAALIFASGYIGAESVWRVSTSLHTSHMIIFLNLAMLFYILSFRSEKRKWLYYVVSLVLFVYTMETGFVRSHGILLMLLGIEFLLNFRWLYSLLRVVPFIYLYKQWYTDSRAGEWLGIFKQKVLEEGDLEVLLAPFRTLQNVFIPDSFTVPLWGFLLVFLGMLIWKRNRLLLMAVIFIVAPYIIPYMINPGQIFESTHRYITASIVGFSIFTTVLLREVFSADNRKYVFFCLLVVASHIVLMNVEEAKIISQRSMPARKFYEILKRELPSLPKGSALYFDVEENADSMSQLGNSLAVGSMSSTTSIALHYGIDRSELVLPETFIELLSLLKNEKVTEGKIYTFYYDESRSLVNTTSSTRNALFGDKKTVFFESIDVINYNFSSPLELDIQLSVDILKQKVEYTGRGMSNFRDYLGYLESQDRYYKEAQVKSSSEWEYQEIRNINDRDRETTWMGHRGYWHDEKHEEVIVDLGRPRYVGAIKIYYQSKFRVPLDYSYQCSSTHNVWQDLGRFSVAPNNHPGVLVDKVTPSWCRLVKLSVYKTAWDDAPQISELEIVDAAYSNLDFDKADKLYQDPFDFMGNPQDLLVLERYLFRNGIDASICFYTDKYNPTLPKCRNIKLQPNKTANYNFIVPVGGTILQRIEVKTPEVVKVKPMKVSLETLSFKELQDKGYILDYSGRLK